MWTARRSMSIHCIGNGNTGAHRYESLTKRALARQQHSLTSHRQNKRAVQTFLAAVIRMNGEEAAQSHVMKTKKKRITDFDIRLF